ncbi:hypothetical protein Vretifemale_9955, partial [Volvox reticuliferus]
PRMAGPDPDLGPGLGPDPDLGPDPAETIVDAVAVRGCGTVGCEVDFTGEGAAHAAVRAGNVQVVAALCRARAGVAVPGPRGITPLHMAAAAGQLDCVRLLVGAGAPLEAREKEGGLTPLHVAVQSRQLEVVEALIAEGVCTTMMCSEMPDDRNRRIVVGPYARTHVCAGKINPKDEAEAVDVSPPPSPPLSLPPSPPLSLCLSLYLSISIYIYI